LKRHKTNLLIFAHEASLTGAPIFLLNLLRSFQSSNEYEFFFIFKNTGPLINDFNKLGHVYHADYLNNTQSKSIRFLIRFLPIYKIRKIILKIRIYFFNPSLFISNTIVNSKTLSIVNKKNRKLITIVHEMKDVISLFDRLKINNSSDVIGKSDKIIAVSRAVEKDLILHNNVQKNKIKVITNTISYFEKIKASDEDILQWKKRNNISNKVFLVGTCGAPIWRKGPDIFLYTVKTFIRTYPKEKVCFIWQGGDPKSAAFLNFESEVLRLDLGDYVRIIPASKKIHFFYNAIDLLISTAREEPFGLTILEAGFYKVPCIAFEKSGGPEEILSENKGIIIPYGNFQNSANEIYSLKNNKKKRNFFSKELNKYSLESSMENNFLKYKKIVDLYSR